MTPLRAAAFSLRVFRAHPLLSYGLGLASVLSGIAVCCGLGLVATPFFVCQLNALQLSSATDGPAPTERRMLTAALYLALGILLLTVALFFSTLGIGIDAPVLGVAGAPDGAPPEITQGDSGTLAFAALASVLVLVFAVPFLYAPLVLLDRGGYPTGAALESVRIVAAGAFSHVVLSVVAHAIQLAPLLIALYVVLTADARIVPYVLAVAILLGAATIPIGQGMVVASYLERRGESRGPVGHFSTPLGSTLASLAVFTPILAIVIALGALLHPSHPQPGALTGGELVADVDARAEPVVTHPPSTALAITLDRGRVLVEASDGGGAGALPLAEEIDRLRILRFGAVYGLELHTRAGVRHTFVDRAGVRLDDHARVRIASRMPPVAQLALVIALLVVPFVWTRALAPLAAARARGEEPSPPAMRAATIATVIVAVPGLVALVFASFAAFAP